MASIDVLALPLAHLVIEAANNEDWIDSLVYVVAGQPPPLPQLDLRGIAFEMHIRRRPQDNEVVLHGSSADGGVTVGAAPNYGHLIFYIPQENMRRMYPGRYVGDVRARNDRVEGRVCLTLDLTIIEGITRT
jgi:hypothetical protein